MGYWFFIGQFNLNAWYGFTYEYVRFHRLLYAAWDSLFWSSHCANSYKSEKAFKNKQNN